MDSFSRTPASAEADQAVWRDLLADLGSTLARLVLLSSTRDLETGRYCHPDWNPRFGEHDTDQALRAWHQRTFVAWLACPLERQFDELNVYLSALDHPEVLIQSWLELEAYQQLMPANLFEGERQLFVGDMRILLPHLELAGSPSRALSSHLDPGITRIMQASAGLPGASVSLKSLGRELQLSQKYLGALFKDFAGVSYRTFLRRARMKKASLLLAGTSNPVKAVGALVGYGDLANFYRDFKSVFGATPADYRRLRATGQSPEPSDVCRSDNK